MDLHEIEKKVNDYYDLHWEHEEKSSPEGAAQLRTMAKELEDLLNLQRNSPFDKIVHSAFVQIARLRELEQLNRHRQWLRRFPEQHLCNWERQLANHPEGAKCEVFVRELLEANGNDVEPYADLSGTKPTPDFRCTQRDRQFFVEVTTIESDRVAKQTHLPLTPVNKTAYAFRSLHRAIFDECTKKTRQCANAGKPVLLAVGWFHFQASVLCTQEHDAEALLTGRTYIMYHHGDNAQGTYLSTKLERSAFLKPRELTGEVIHARNPISGIILCGLGCDPPVFRGALHPQPVHAFDRCLLPRVPFVRLRPGYEAGNFQTEWI